MRDEKQPRPNQTNERGEEKRSLEIRECLPFTFTQDVKSEGELAWNWRSKVSELEAKVRFDAEHDMIILSVRDTRVDKTISRWTTKVYMTGAWRKRLRRASGESLILAQRRPHCPKCQSEMLVRERHSDNAQFFGCPAYPNCKGLVDIIDHDIETEKNRAVSDPIRAIRQDTIAATATGVSM